MSGNYDDGWLFTCCPNETECDCDPHHVHPRFACVDHCDRTPLCAGSKVDDGTKPVGSVSPEHIQEWYDWAGRILDGDGPAEDWQLNCACARLRVAIQDLRRARDDKS